MVKVALSSRPSVVTARVLIAPLAPAALSSSLGFSDCIWAWLTPVMRTLRIAVALFTRIGVTLATRPSVFPTGRVITPVTEATGWSLRCRRTGRWCRTRSRRRRRCRVPNDEVEARYESFWRHCASGLYPSFRVKCMYNCSKFLCAELLGWPSNIVRVCASASSLPQPSSNHLAG